MRLLIVGWDAADWKIIRPLLASGEMPHLAKLIGAGVHGNLATIYPALSPMLWTSIATGKRPDKHGIIGFTEPTEDGLAVRPVSILGRKTKAFWNILNQHGKRSVVVGWWPSHPAEPIHGAMVSNHFPFQTSQDPRTPMPPGTIHPAAEMDAMADLRVHPTEISSDILRLFAPEWRQVNQDGDRSIHHLAGIIAETMSIHAAATDLMERVEWDVAAVYYCGIDHFSHRFMRSYAGKRATKSNERDPFADVVPNAYRYHDVMLGRLMSLAGPDCAVIVLSDHGFHSDVLLPDYIPAEAAGPAVEHRHFGIFCMKAPGVKRGEEIYGAGVLDVAPTVLHLLGLPAGGDMDGHVLINAFEQAEPRPPVPSWDDVPGQDGSHPASRHYDGVSAAESLKQLVDLGYIAPPGANMRRTVAECVLENRYNLARSHLDAGRPDLCAEVIRELLIEDPEDARLYRYLFDCHLKTGDHAGAARVTDAFDRVSAECAPKAAAELQRRRQERPDEDLKRDCTVDFREAYERRKLMEKAAGAVADRMFLRVRLELARARTRKKKDSVRPMLEALARQTGRSPQIHLFLAEAFGAIGDSAQALQFARRVLVADPENAAALALQARLHYAAGSYADAAASAVDSLALVYFQPWLHWVLGNALFKLREFSRAEQAYRVALTQAPGFAQAHEALGRLLRRQHDRTGEAALHLAQAAVARERGKRTPAMGEDRAVASLPEMDANGPISPPPERSKVVTVVTGLPRSGTSMMMQMLAAGGIEPYSDGKRRPDPDNPRGYFEHENATELHRDASWVPEARGKVVKIVAHLLPYLPPGEEYRIVFMNRPLAEVTASQRAMLRRLGRKGAALDESKLSRVYAGQLVRVQEWLKKAPKVSVMAMQYARILEDPAAAAGQLATFLGQPFHPEAAAASVDCSLRRQVG